jgi:AcrR family transcriptional regulator
MKPILQHDDSKSRRRSGAVRRTDAEMMGVQRVRIVAAMVEVASERGAANATVAHVVERAGISRRTYYELFADREECFLAALDDSIARASAHVLAGWEAGASWTDRVRGALVGLLEFLDDSPSAGRLLVVESLGAGAGALAHREQALAHAVAAIDLGRREPKAAQGLSPMTAEGVVGAVLAVLHSRVAQSRPGPPDPVRLSGLTGQLMSMIVIPYLGPAAARRELRRSSPRHALPRGEPRPAGNPLAKLEMRLTYRTIRVLVAVAEHPGSSNRRIAEVAEIVDQGQMSKLLARLHSLGLIENTGAGGAQGAPNAWALTDEGRRVHAAIGVSAVAA